jgi:hypothetical protein
MPISRMDLDKVGSPDAIVGLVLKLDRGQLSVPVKIENLCSLFDISKIIPLETEGFEGGLITDEDKYTGVILYNQNSSVPRRRFTIAHELGHFLIPTHKVTAEGRFLCSQQDMFQLAGKEQDRRARMEVEANRFASLILIPPPELRAQINLKLGPSLHEMIELAKIFQVSKEAMARSYVNNHEELVAVAVIQNGKILRLYRDRFRFPFIQVAPGAKVPMNSFFYRNCGAAGACTDFAECTPDLWIDIERGKRAPEMLEQVHYQRDGYALILLHLVQAGESEEDEDEHIEQRWRQPRFRR